MFVFILVGVVCAVIVLGILWLMWEVRHAPEGYQDETGFHLGKPGYEPLLDRKFPQDS